MTLSVVVAEDEPLARRRLTTLLSRVPWAELVGEATDGSGALEVIGRLRPNIVFLDIQMPALTGIEVLERVRGLELTPVVVFTTAYDRYAVIAFELEAVDYLLKPFGERRFLAALERARRTVVAGGATDALRRAHLALEPGSATAPLGRVLVRDGAGALVPLAPEAIEHIEAQDDYCLIHAAGRSFLVSVRLQDLEVRLTTPPFLRIHRSFLVNLDHVERMQPLGDGRFLVRMRGGLSLSASRTRSQEIRRHVW